MYLVFIS